ncbi:MAG TPA: universal stress protein [Candidatus Acidoferrales bacterium]|jgi:nucleotide-binding universal stress UspA family protein|nr:universal stress protein [Candidatus Acidoferrales bacterium]
MRVLDPRVRVRINNILLCTDFSGAAEAAFPYAVDLARHFGAKLRALYVRNPDEYVMAFPEGGSVPTGFTEEQARSHLHALLAGVSDLDHEEIVAEGEVWPSIESIVAKNDIDLIVVGTRGRGGIAKLVLGSRAEEIFRRATCPVLTVAAHLAEHLPSGEIKHILYATDLTPEAAVAAPYAVSLAQEYQASLTLLHVITEPRTGDLVQPHDLIASTERRLRELVPPEAELWCEPRFEVEQGSPADTILDVARLRKADLIVMGLHRSTGMATRLPMATAHRVVAGAKAPVLTVRS